MKGSTRMAVQGIATDGNGRGKSVSPSSPGTEIERFLFNLLKPVCLFVLVFDLKTESEWGKPGQPTALPDLPDHLGPCMRAPRPHS